MTALWSDEHPRTGDPLMPGATPAAIRNALLSEDRADLDPTELFGCLEHWRRVALLRRNPDLFASIARRAAERLTGEAVPADEPLERTRRRAGL